MLKNALTITLLLFAGVSAVPAQTVTQKSSKITNNNSKLWIITAIDTYMSGNACTKGEMWKFYSSGKVLVSKCVDRLVKNEERNWTLQKQGIDFIMKVGSDSYVLIGPTRLQGNKERIKLRLKTGGQVDPTKDIIFIYEPD